MSGSFAIYTITQYTSFFFSLQRTDSLERADLLANLKPGGKYDHIVAIYRAYRGKEPIFDRAVIDALPPTVRWIAHNGAGYDSIDIKACKDKGT